MSASRALQAIAGSVVLALMATVSATADAATYSSPGYRPRSTDVKITGTRTPAARPNLSLDAGGVPSNAYDVLIDGAGTAHIVWAQSIAGPVLTTPKVGALIYCRLPRAATACAVRTPLATFAGQPNVGPCADGDGLGHR